MEDVTVAFPFRPGCEYRERASQFVSAAYEKILPGVRKIFCDSGHAVFNRAASRNMAVKIAARGVVVIADADILPDEAALRSAIDGARMEGFISGMTTTALLCASQRSGTTDRQQSIPDVCRFPMIAVKVRAALSRYGVMSG